jgi:hypothetical protein
VHLEEDLTPQADISQERIRFTLKQSSPVGSDGLSLEKSGISS